ncbi:hypothetical protein V8G54_037679 [Vigna mungo]|uniref:Uncharacterized protein n=1 Tax=Vigna mungo TaxID=3915 RepID=A0AAQ3MJP7_VIGMU
MAAGRRQTAKTMAKESENLALIPYEIVEDMRGNLPCVKYTHRATMDHKQDPEKPKSWPKFILRVDHRMCEYLTSGKKTRLATLSSYLKVWILLKVARGLTRGSFEVKPFTDDKVEKNQHQVAISMLRSSEARTKKPGQNVTLVQGLKLGSKVGRAKIMSSLLGVAALFTSFDIPINSAMEG